MIMIIVCIAALLIAVAILKTMRASDNVIISFLGSITTIILAIIAGTSSGIAASAVATPFIGVPVGFIVAGILLSVVFS